MSNYPCIQNLVIIDKLLPQVAGFTSLKFEKSAAAAAAAAAIEQFRHRDLDPHTKQGKLNEFQKKNK